MALKGFMAKGEASTGSTTGAPSPRLAVPPGPRTVSPSTSVDASTELEGTLRCKETLRIDGRVKGNIECEKAVLVGEGAKVQAGIQAHEMRIAGTVEGNLVARRKITLARTAVVKGDLITPGIVIEEGAQLKGRIVIGSEVEPVEAPKPVKAAPERKAPKKTPAAAKPGDGGRAVPSEQPTQVVG